MGKKWYMTDDEIRRSWRCAKDPVEQIKIIAELNCKTKQEVVTKLEELGIVAVKETKRRHSGGRKKIDEATRNEIWMMKIDGATYPQIAASVDENISVSTIRKIYLTLLEERKKALPTLQKALEAYMQGDACTDEEREIITTQIARRI